MTPALPTLADALAQVESTQTALGTADGVLTMAEQKLTSAQAAQQQASTDDVTAITSANAAIDTAVQVLNATKRPVPAAA